MVKQKSYRDWFLFVIGVHIGLRISDLLKLKVKDVQGKTHITINEEKTGKEKRFKINSTLLEWIEEYTRRLGPEKYLFPSRK